MTEQEFIERIIAGDLDALLYNLDLCIEQQAELDCHKITTTGADEPTEKTG